MGPLCGRLYVCTTIHMSAYCSICGACRASAFGYQYRCLYLYLQRGAKKKGERAWGGVEMGPHVDELDQVIVQALDASCLKRQRSASEMQAQLAKVFRLRNAVHAQQSLGVAMPINYGQKLDLSFEQTSLTNKLEKLRS